MAGHFARLMQALPLSLRRQDGQTFVEYALVLLLVAVFVSTLIAWSNLRNAITNDLSRVVNNL
jgi:Flp pilus assembly pilin Flp